MKSEDLHLLINLKFYDKIDSPSTLLIKRAKCHSLEISDILIKDGRNYRLQVGRESKWWNMNCNIVTHIMQLACLHPMWDASMKDQNILTSFIVTIIPNHLYKMPKAGQSIFFCSPSTRHCDSNSNHTFSLNCEVGCFLIWWVGWFWFCAFKLIADDCLY